MSIIWTLGSKLFGADRKVKAPRSFAVLIFGTVLGLGPALDSSPSAQVPSPAPTPSLELEIPSTLATGESTTADKEYRLKALFLHRFCLFVRWPKSKTSTLSSFTIGVIGKDPFGSHLDALKKQKPVSGLPIAVKRCKTSADVAKCQAVYVAPTASAKDLRELAKVAALNNVLLVGDQAKFANTCGVFNFVLVKNKIRFEANPGIAKHCKLVVSSKCLKLAHKVIK